MFKKYDPRLVRSYHSYKVADLCRLYRDKKLHAQTIRGWINSGKLTAFTDGKNILVYGAVFKQFLLDMNKKHKRTLAFTEFRCGKCKTIAAPLHNTISTMAPGRNGCILAYGVCVSCGHKITRIYARSTEEKILQSFTVQHNELAGLWYSSCTTSKTHIEIEPLITLREPPEKPSHTEPPHTVTSTGKTHLKYPETSSTTSKTNLPPQQLSLF